MGCAVSRSDDDFRAQFAQDEFVLQWTRFKRNGFFVDVGAHDGRQLSNTWTLEKTHGWSGICIEPHPNTFVRLQQLRSCTCIPAACTSTTGFAWLLLDHHRPMLSRLLPHDTPFHPNEGTQIVMVPTRTLDDILKDAPLRMDFLSIDVEGAELEVLKGWTPALHRFDLICIEHNQKEPARSDIRAWMNAHAYSWLGENVCDDWYIPTLS